MPSKRIYERGGPKARLSFFKDHPLPIPKAIHAAFAVTLCLALTPPVRALESPLQSLLGLDFERHIWMPGTAPVSPFDSSGSAVGVFGMPVFSASATYDHVNLISKTGRPAFNHAESMAGLHLATGAIPHLQIRVSTQRSQRALDIGDDGAGIDLGGESWGWNGSIAYLFTPWLVPTLTVAGDSHAGGRHALRSLGIKGAVGREWNWFLAFGDKSLDYPLTMDLREYRPMRLPLQLRQQFLELGVRYRHGTWEGFWSGRRLDMHYPDPQPQGYALGDSGSVWKQSVGFAYDRIRPGSGFRASLDFDMGYGTHVFRGVNRKEESLYRFSYQEAHQLSYSIRSDFQAAREAWEWGAFAGALELEYNALRPDGAKNRHFWDRNGVIDSYEGGFLGIFNNETWLFNGAAYAAQTGSGLWVSRTQSGWKGSLGLAWQFLMLESNSRLSKRETNLILAYKEESFDRTYPSVEAHFLTPEAGLSKTWGPVFLSATAAQALPVKVEIKRDGKGNGTGDGSGRDPEFSGGTRGRLEIGLRLP